ncbi:unnamed protein product [Polarella glacialis]|uniref:Rab-GAP TBC domain-containing protein n=1 Tax=Polarella glacialis TaxID=89957 RepID=A0A813GLY6_POLGL|nr:unnamed protein product [Polarella glacialis]
MGSDLGLPPGLAKAFLSAASADTGDLARAPGRRLLAELAQEGADGAAQASAPAHGCVVVESPLLGKRVENAEWHENHARLKEALVMHNRWKHNEAANVLKEARAWATSSISSAAGLSFMEASEDGCGEGDPRRLRPGQQMPDEVSPQHTTWPPHGQSTAKDSQGHRAAATDGFARDDPESEIGAGVRPPELRPSQRDTLVRHIGIAAIGRHMGDPDRGSLSIPDIQDKLSCRFTSDADCGQEGDLLEMVEESDDESRHACRQRWLQLWSEGLEMTFRRQPERFRRSALLGIPPEMRWEAWKVALGLSSRKTHGQYLELLSSETSWRRLIDVDAPRTFPQIPRFDEEYRDSQRRILHAYANFNSEVGYCQETGGRRFLDVRLLDGGLGTLSKHFASMDIMQYVDVFNEQLEASLPGLVKHFAHEGLQATDFLHTWYLTLFIGCLPLAAVLEIWDGMICCGGLPVLVPVAIALLEAIQHILRDKPFEDIMDFLRELSKGLEDEPEAGRVGVFFYAAFGNFSVVPGAIRFVEIWY